MKNLFGEDVGKRARGATKTLRQKEALGCIACDLDRAPGAVKVINLDLVTGQKVFVWAQTPGARESEQGLELVGPSGQFLWDELRAVGITREDCDIQNICRCQPVTSVDGNTPTKRQIKCCSVHSAQAIQRNGGAAVVHLILGKIAGLELLGKLYSKAKAAVWVPQWNAYAVCADHPARVLRAGGKKAGWLYWNFKDKVKAVKAILDHPGRWGYVEAQDYGAVTTPREIIALAREVKKNVANGKRVAVDIEDGEINGEKAILMVGFSTRKGRARSVVLRHPEIPVDDAVIDALTMGVAALLEDPAIPKTFQHGSYDVNQLRDLLGVRVRGYVFDTQYAAFLWRSHLRTYGLDSLVGYFLQEFGDYKQMVAEYYPNLANAPLDRLVKYNGADCDVTKRVELMTEGKISLELLRVYIHAAFTLNAMEGRGPILDREALAKLKDFLAPRVEELTRQLKQIAEDPEFNPNTPAKVAALLYDQLGLPKPEDPKTHKPSRSTGKDALDFLTQQSRHPAIRLMQRHRKASKMLGALAGYEKSADMHGGELRTIWWLCGAATGRLRSGKSEKAEVEEGVMNFQNLARNVAMKNPLVSDVNWRLALED